MFGTPLPPLFSDIVPSQTATCSSMALRKTLPGGPPYRGRSLVRLQKFYVLALAVTLAHAIARMFSQLYVLRLLCARANGALSHARMRCRQIVGRPRLNSARITYNGAEGEIPWPSCCSMLPDTFLEHGVQTPAPCFVSVVSSCILPCYTVR